MVKKTTAYVGYKLPSNPTGHVGFAYSKSDGTVIDILHIYRKASKVSIDRIMGGVNE